MAIGLSPPQNERIRMIEDDAAYGWLRGEHRLTGSSRRSGTGTAIPTPHDRILEVLTDDQIGKWRELIGKPIEGAIFPFRSSAALMVD